MNASRLEKMGGVSNYREGAMRLPVYNLSNLSHRGPAHPVLRGQGLATWPGARQRIRLIP